MIHIVVLFLFSYLLSLIKRKTSFSDRVLTASFDKTACVWNSDTGERLLTMWGHEGELVVIKYDNSRQHVATGSMDQTARVFDINTGRYGYYLLL